MVLIVCALIIGVVCGASDGLQCGKDEMMCYDENLCVPKKQWCDGYSDCNDRSDENYCSGVGVYGQVHADVPIINEFLSSDVMGTSKNALVKAVNYILSKKNIHGDWGPFTPRAVIALAFASRESAVSEQEMQLLQKRLNVELLFNLMHNGTRVVNSCTLALYINALYATCQDPRNFKGMDLIARLRNDVETAKRNDSALPLPMLTLCLANDIKGDDGKTLVQMHYNAKTVDRPGYEALTAMALICHSRTDRDYSVYIHEYISKYQTRLYDLDIYNKALLMQTQIANRDRVVTAELASDQQEDDGSFGDLLSTYYAIPVMMQSSLLDLKCANPTYTAAINYQNLMMSDHALQQHVIFSMWIDGFSKDVRSHSLTLSFDGQKTLEDIMLMAAERDPIYRFSVEETSRGKIVYSLANIPSDIESGKSWSLYTGNIGKVALNSDRNLRAEELGIDRVQAQDGIQFVFWLKRT